MRPRTLQISRKGTTRNIQPLSRLCHRINLHTFYYRKKTTDNRISVHFTFHFTQVKAESSDLNNNTRVKRVRSMIIFLIHLLYLGYFNTINPDHQKQSIFKFQTSLIFSCGPISAGDHWKPQAIHPDLRRCPLTLCQHQGQGQAKEILLRSYYFQLVKLHVK